MRPLGPTTEKLYASILARAYGSPAKASQTIPAHVREWSEPTLALLRAALRRRAAERGEDGGWVKAALPTRYAVKRVTRVPGEEDAEAYEAAAAQYPRGVRVVALLPLALGLRAAEVCNLPRANVELAIRTGELIVLRKGGEEQGVGVSNLKPLLKELLDVEKRVPYRIEDGPAPLERAGKWDVVGEVLTTGGPKAAYNRLHELVREVGAKAGLKGMRPHLLRHAFATRMNRDGAPLFTIQAALNHKQISTTQRYVHASASDVEKYQRRVRF